MSSDLLGAFGAQVSTSRSGSKSEEVNRRIDPEDEEDDEFGDFEDAQKDYEDLDIQDKSNNLLKLNNEASVISGSQIQEHKGWIQSSHIADERQPGQDDEWGDFAGQGVMFDANQFEQKPLALPRKLTRKQQIYAPVEKFNFDADDDWDPVDISQAPIVPTNKAPVAAGPEKTAEEVITKEITMVTRKDLGPPPTNIPPPSMLLSVITDIFQTISAKIKGIVTLDRASSDPQGLEEIRISGLQNQMSILRASARIIAGRRLRWQRDTILSQSMKIGPAGYGGLKLSSLNKNETLREDQELSEAVYLWKEQIGPLRSTIAKVNIHLPSEGFIIPDISETISVRQGSPSEGAIKASKCCFLCGVNRDERVAKVDVRVEDSFGEWWVEHWGHVDCVQFWKTEKASLPQR